MKPWYALKMYFYMKEISPTLIAVLKNVYTIINNKLWIWKFSKLAKSKNQIPIHYARRKKNIMNYLSYPFARK